MTEKENLADEIREIIKKQMNYNSSPSCDSCGYEWSRGKFTVSDIKEELCADICLCDCCYATIKNKKISIISEDPRFQVSLVEHFN